MAGQLDVISDSILKRFGEMEMNWDKLDYILSDKPEEEAADVEAQLTLAKAKAAEAKDRLDEYEEMKQIRMNEMMKELDEIED